METHKFSYFNIMCLSEDSVHGPVAICGAAYGQLSILSVLQGRLIAQSRTPNDFDVNNQPNAIKPDGPVELDSVHMKYIECAAMCNGR